MLSSTCDSREEIYVNITYRLRKSTAGYADVWYSYSMDAFDLLVII